MTMGVSRRLVRIRLLAALLALLWGVITAAVAHAAGGGRAEEETDTDRVAAVSEIPDTPLGQRLAWTLAMVAGEGDRNLEGIFSPAYKERVNPEHLLPHFGRLSTDLKGVRLLGVREENPFALQALCRANEGGTWWRITLQVERNEPHRIEELLVQPLLDKGSISLRSAWRDLDSLLARRTMPRSSFAAWELHDSGRLSPVHRNRAGDRLAIASVMQVYVLGAIAAQLDAGELHWDEILFIRDEHKSLPDTELRLAEHGSPRTLEQFIRAMVRQGDNTAIDHMIHLVGRGRVETFMEAMHGEPSRNRPFLTTKEAIRLKLASEPRLRHRFIRAGEEARRDMLREEVPHIEIEPERLDTWENPIMIDQIEWFASADELVRAVAALHALSERDNLARFSSVLNRATGDPLTVWPIVWAFSGVEAGVMAQAWFVERADGRRFIVAAVFNDATQALNETHCRQIGQHAIHTLGLIE